MLKPPAPTIPGMTDSLEFVKNLWGSMNVPGMGVPGMGASPLSTDELDKKIADLKAVESWLNLNTTMLRGTIHALEVQRGTIATLKTMSTSMAQAMGQGGEQAGASFAQFFGQPQAGGAQAGKQSRPQAQSQQGQPQQAQPQQAQSRQGAQGGASQGAATPPGAAALPAAVAWWNLLQDQFNQAVASAMSPEAMAGAAAMAQNAARLATGMPAAAQPDAQAKPGTGNGGGSAQPGAAKPRPGNGKS